MGLMQASKTDKVVRMLELIPWWKEVILQDAPVRLLFEAQTAFFKQHRLSRHLVFRRFFDSVLAPVVLAAHS